ncbi:molybdopterin biosynthesis protein MoeB [Sulfuriferula sp. AH1]|uniref:HesA/MoeB/ThiF family protein n=1 Tax=Sulfuriferula sp. AH1 TaxID=1985873 RepID=UPI000B3B171C|nr:molybdopterin-synthase adenylyltransferase MoeB [Sulfuriferula sp. AH1]ARU32160.1 molybdopterin biosynthesis protein MoeB [Sulfuriferula sp. AH1]
MQDADLLRYSRHILLNDIGITGQQAILDARVLIIGAGGLGSPVALYLAASGVGHITIADNDSVDCSNLQRQIIHDDAAIGQNKAVSAAASIHRLNPRVHVTPVCERLSGTLLEHHVAAHDVIIDASDNFATRHAINRACLAHRKPLVSGAAVRFDGQVSIFDMRRPDSPCYHCLYPENSDADEVRCAENGVFSPLVGIIGATQAAEALKLICGAGKTLNGRLLLLDALDMQWRSIKLTRDSECDVCGQYQPTADSESAAN